uniref:Interleukin-15 receptor subunit alpha n=1 Tax=Aotus nancymaae TaxID=37293 RepID=A0A2K5EPD9_AOTNA
MARLRARGCRTLGLPALLLLLLLQPPATLGITCPAPVSVEHADIWVKSYSLHSRERYICNSGFKRKAGTSSLTECVLNKATNIAYWTTPSLKCIKPAASSPSSGTTMATTAALVLGSRLTPSKSPSTGTTGIGSHESSHSPSQTAARTWELTASASHQLPDAYPAGNSSTIQTPRPVSVEMEAMEALPVTRGTSDRDEDSENRTHNL